MTAGSSEGHQGSLEPSGDGIQGGAQRGRNRSGVAVATCEQVETTEAGIFWAVLNITLGGGSLSTQSLSHHLLW